MLLLITLFTLFFLLSARCFLQYDRLYVENEIFLYNEVGCTLYSVLYTDVNKVIPCTVGMDIGHITTVGNLTDDANVQLHVIKFSTISSSI